MYKTGFDLVGTKPGQKQAFAGVLQLGSDSGRRGIWHRWTMAKFLTRLFYTRFLGVCSCQAKILSSCY